LLIFPTLLCVFVGVACLVLYGIKKALLASIIIIPSSHNIDASCYCSVDHFIPTVAIMKYDYKPTLNTIVRKLCGWYLYTMR
jgi:hypothetical protein